MNKLLTPPLPLPYMGGKWLRIVIERSFPFTCGFQCGFQCGFATTPTAVSASFSMTGV
ncbi:MAG: hypothetical protein IJ533_10530 [Prevotella sp.]|nr:hypothetical protein [Prevotella sp.]MBQ8488068.1 hypothetical protein [Prevotella sp.]